MTPAQKAALDALPSLKSLIQRIRNSRVGHYGDRVAYVLENGVSEKTLQSIENEVAALTTPAANTGDGPTVRYKNSLSEKEYPDHDLTTGALAALSNLMILSNADTATFEIENDVDGRFVFKATRTKPSAALQRPEPSDCPYKIPPSGCSMSGGCACSQLKADADNAYCRYVDQIDKYCRGTDQKIENHSFTRKDLSAHANANELLGFHRGVHHALAALAPRQVDVFAVSLKIAEAVFDLIRYPDNQLRSMDRHAAAKAVEEILQGNLLAAAPTQDKGE